MRLVGKNRQQGAVLLLALIALVAMVVGALAMFRSIDSATGVAGNIGFRQQGVAVTDVGVEAAMNWLSGGTDLENNHAGNGYYATHSFGLTNGDILSLNWEANALKLPDQNGFEIWLVIHRLCNEIGPPTPGRCPESGNTINQGSGKPGEALATGGISALYRITVRSLGPRRSESIVQVITY
jgi:type IV pilus assembly protein PilX